MKKWVDMIVSRKSRYNFDNAKEKDIFCGIPPLPDLQIISIDEKENEIKSCVYKVSANLNGKAAEIEFVRVFICIDGKEYDLLRAPLIDREISIDGLACRICGNPVSSDECIMIDGLYHAECYLNGN